MNLQALLDRVMDAVDEVAYLTPAAHVDPAQRAAMGKVAEALKAPDMDPTEVKGLVQELHRAGRIDRVKMLSALHVIAAHPRVRDWTQAARLAGEQEQAALELGGPYLEANLASVERHRGVLAFLQGHHELALDYFSRAFERERTAENLGNVLCALITLGDLAEARELYARIRRGFPSPLVLELQDRVLNDPDLVLLREEKT